MKKPGATRALHSILLFALVGLATATLTISFLPLHSTRVISGLSIAGFLMLLCQKKIVINLNGLLIYFFLVIYVIYVGILTVFSGSGDLVYLKKSTSLLLDGVPSAVFIALILIYKNRFHEFPKDRAFYDFCLFFFWFSVFVSITVIGSFLIPEFRVIVESLFPAQGNIIDSSHPDYSYRIRGILPATGASASVYFAFGVVLGLVASERVMDGGYFKKFATIIGFFTLITALILNGRSGFVVLAIGAVTLFFYFVFKCVVCHVVTKGLLLNVLFLIFILMFSGYLFLTTEVGNFKAMYRLVDDFLLIISSGGSEGTVGALIDMYFIPPSKILFLFGDVSTFNSNRIPSDVGYIRVLHSVGVFGFILFYLFWVVSYLTIIFGPTSIKLKVLFCYLIIITFILESKEPFFLYLYLATILMVPISIYCLSPRILPQVPHVK